MSKNKVERSDREETQTASIENGVDVDEVVPGAQNDGFPVARENTRGKSQLADVCTVGTKNERESNEMRERAMK
jgi:hypothetical protein